MMPWWAAQKSAEVYTANVTAVTLGPSSTTECPLSWMRDPLYPTVPADWNVVTDTGCPASLAGNSGNPATPSRCKLAAQSSASNETDWRCYVSLVTAVVYKDASTTFVGEPAERPSSRAVGTQEKILLKRCRHMPLPKVGDQFVRGMTSVCAW
jgi:hypothetical protein